MTMDFKDVVVAMSTARPNARVSTIVALALSIEGAVKPADLHDAERLGRWAATQPEVSPFVALGDTNAKIHAIKELRALTGASLRQAKDAIETIRPWSR